MELLQGITTAIPEAFSVFTTVWTEGWFVIAPVVLAYMMYWYWQEFMVGRYFSGIKYINLHIEAPPENDQSPKVMEEFFNAVHGIHTNPNFTDYFWDGKIQEGISVEMVGVDGDVSFIVRTPDYFKDLVEAHLYAQFPDVEIHEEPDYVEAVPKDFLKKGWDVFGSDIVLTTSDFYPIRSYITFEHQMTQRIIDPIATIAEVMNKLGPGEQLWIQFNIRPILNDWAKRGQEFAKDLMGQETAAPTPAVIEALGKVGSVAATPMTGDTTAADSYDAFPDAAFLMPPNERKVIENIERNVSKQAFEFKGRLLYVGKKEGFNKRRFNAIMGAFKQFSTFDMNGFMPYQKTMTKVSFFFKNIRVPIRQRKLMSGYKQRSFSIGAPVAVLNTESLASVFHIPDVTVKAPRLPRTLSKKGSAPPNLPITDQEVSRG